MSSSTAVIAVVLLLMDVTARSTLLSGAQSECVIRPNESIRLSLEAGLEHSCSVVVDDAWKPSDPLGSTSAVVFQLHAQRANVSLRFDGCKEVVGCGPAPAPHVGLLKPLSANNSVHAFNFNLSCVCLHGGACNGSGGVTSGGNGNDDGCCCGSGEKINVLAAAVPLLSYAPIPGGCGLTSTLEQDPNTYVSYSRDVTTVTFQSGDVGFDPSSGQTIPVCDSGPDPPFKQMNYSLYKRFLPMRSFSEDDMFDALEEMLTAMTVESSNKLTRKTLKYSDNKMVRVSSMPGQGVVYNVIAEYTSSGEYYNNNNNNNKNNYYQSTTYSSAYVPFVSYGCDLLDEEGGGGCVGLFSYGDYAITGLVAALGLLLCFFSQAKPQMFHFEMLALNFIIWLFIWYVVLGATTSWSHTVELGAIVGLSVAMAIVLYGLWSAVGLTLAHLMWFSSVGGFLIAATLLFTPVGELYWLGYGYIYALVLLCGMTLVLVPLVLFPRFMNIVTTALIGSYCVVFFVGLFTYSSLNEIVLRVARTAANPDLLGAVNDYPFEIIDMGLSGLWFLLFVSGVAVQSLLSKWDEKRSKAKHRGSKYSPFPLHPCKAVRNRRSLSRRQQQQQQRQRQLCNCRSEDARDSERRPLLSPATQQYHAPPPPPPARAQQRAQFVQVVQQEGQMDGVQYREVTYRMVSATN